MMESHSSNNSAPQHQSRLVPQSELSSQLPPHSQAHVITSSPTPSSPLTERPQSLSCSPHVVHSLSSQQSMQNPQQIPSCSSPAPMSANQLPSNNSAPNLIRPKVANRVILNVNGEKMTVDTALFLNYPNTMLGRMFGPSLDHNLTKKNAKGEFEVGGYVTDEVFRLIIEFYKLGFMRIPSHIQVSEVKVACDYFLIPFSEETVRAANMAALLHELANEGANGQFSQFLDNIIRPVIVQLARKGERECHVVVLMSEDLVDWDLEYPPPKYPDQPEVEASLIRDDHLCRFLKYVENRDVAKTVLKDRGLKKIKLGIEGFPTQKEKMKTTIRGRNHLTSYYRHSDMSTYLLRPEVVYNYIQRPFIHFSWEKEEARSRHVDFQCPPVNLSTNLAEAASDTDIDQPQGTGGMMMVDDMNNGDSGVYPGMSAGSNGSMRLPPHLYVNTEPSMMQQHSPPIGEQDPDDSSAQAED